MAISIAIDESNVEEIQFGSETSSYLTTMEQDKNIQNEELRLTPQFEYDNHWLFPSNRALELKDCFNKIKPLEFSISTPWLPPNALKLLNKLKMGSISGVDLNRLMETVADRAIVHFSLRQGQFVALSFSGRVVEVSDTRVGLLKKLQGQKNPGAFFVWRVGFKAFSGRL
jgi:hypothetical protein